MKNYKPLIGAKDCRLFVSLIFPSLIVMLSTEDVKRLLGNQKLEVEKAAAREREKKKNAHGWIDCSQLCKSYPISVPFKQR